MNHVTKEIEQYFRSSLQRGEQRKILYLYDKEKNYQEELANFAKETKLFLLVEVNDSNYIYTNYLIEKEFLRENLFLYFPMDQPPDEENPLLDVLLYSHELKLDHQSQLSAELGVDVDSPEISRLIEVYQTFFNAKERRSRFSRMFTKSLKKNTDDFEMSIYATLAKVNQPDWIEVFIALFGEVNQDKQPIWDSIQKFGNESRFWELVYQIFSYEESNPSLKKLLQTLIITHVAEELKGELPKELQSDILPENNRALVFINQWMNQRNQRDTFTKAAMVIEEKLQIAEKFGSYPLKELSRAETFRQFDEYILESIAESLLEQAPDLDFYESLIQKRRDTFWYQDFRNDYHLLKWAIHLIREVSQLNLTNIRTKQELWEEYAEKYWRIDQAYRKFYFYYDQLNEHSQVFRQLQERIENQYLYKFLAALSMKWDTFTERNEKVETIPQNTFYERAISPLVKQDKKVFVIISDGLRFEAGNDLFERLVGSNRYNGTLYPIQASLPSFTALGMAAILPHETLEIQGNAEVLVDRLKSNSTENRGLILQKYLGENGMAINYEEIIQKSRDELRLAFNGKKVIYIYHNRIDAIGDQKQTEHSVFQAVEDSLHQLHRLLNRLVSEVSASQVFITADHGFLYQRSPVKTTQKVQMDQKSLGPIRNKRFVIGGKELENIEGISQSLENGGIYSRVAFPRGINRFTFSGGGYQYVHGGSLPQETMIPVLDLKAIRGVKRLLQVDVTLLNQNRILTNDVVWLSFLQTVPASNEVKEKRLAIYFEDKSGIPISNEVSLIAGSRDKLNENRIYERKFVILKREFAAFENCYLVMKNIEDEKDVQKEVFEIDIVQ